MDARAGESMYLYEKVSVLKVIVCEYVRRRQHKEVSFSSLCTGLTVSLNSLCHFNL